MGIDEIILLIGRTKRKARDIKRILSDKRNFDLEKDKDGIEYYKIYSLRDFEKWYKVDKSDITGLFRCDCEYNYRWREYKQGNRKKNATECVHILALKVHLKLSRAGEDKI